MSKINIKKPSPEQINTLRIYLNRAIQTIEKIEKSNCTFNDELVQSDPLDLPHVLHIYNQELEDDIIHLFAWLTTISSFQECLFIKDDED